MCFDAVSQCWLPTSFFFLTTTTTTNNSPHQNSPSSSFTSPSSSFSSCEMRDHSRDLQKGRELNMSNLLPFRTAHHCAFFGLFSDLFFCETIDIRRFPYQVKRELMDSNLNTHVCMHTHMPAHTHAHTGVHKCMHACTRAHTHTCMYWRMHAHRQVHTHTHTHRHIYLHTCMHTHTHRENQQLTHHSKLPSIHTRCPMGFSHAPSGSDLPCWVSLCPSGIKPFTCHCKKCTHFRSVDKHLVQSVTCFFTPSQPGWFYQGELGVQKSVKSSSQKICTFPKSTYLFKQ